MADETVPFALVVEDDAIVRMDVVEILQNAGFRSLDAADPSEALELLEARGDSIVLLFTDVEMPGEMNGLGLAREVALRWPETSIVVASGRHVPGPGELPDGAAFIRKPFTAELVYNRLQELLPDGAKPEPLKARV
jgi:CheY-like chemotaxis protein